MIWTKKICLQTRMLPSRQKRSGWVFFLQASILQLNESMKLWTPFLLLSLTLRIRQPCWKISSTPSVYCKASISNEGGGKAPGQQAVGAGRGWALPYMQAPLLPTQLFSSLPKTHLAVRASIVATHTHEARKKKISFSSSLPLIKGSEKWAP